MFQGLREGFPNAMCTDGTEGTEAGMYVAVCLSGVF